MLTSNYCPLLKFLVTPSRRSVATCLPETGMSSPTKLPSYCHSPNTWYICLLLVLLKSTRNVMVYWYFYAMHALRNSLKQKVQFFCFAHRLMLIQNYNQWIRLTVNGTRDRYRDEWRSFEKKYIVLWLCFVFTELNDTVEIRPILDWYLLVWRYQLIGVWCLWVELVEFNVPLDT